MFDFTYEVGRYRGREYWIGVRADPTLNDVESFAVVLFSEALAEEREEYVEVAKRDDSEHRHGTIHFDRYYRERERESRDFDVEVDSVFEAEQLLRADWRRYARRYERNHGRDDSPQERTSVSTSTAESRV